MRLKPKPLRAAPIRDAEAALKMDDLRTDRFKLVAESVDGVWDYFVPVGMLHGRRDNGSIVTVQGRVDGRPVLYAKLATVRH